MAAGKATSCSVRSTLRRCTPRLARLSCCNCVVDVRGVFGSLSGSPRVLAAFSGVPLRTCRNETRFIQDGWRGCEVRTMSSV